MGNDPIFKGSWRSRSHFGFLGMFFVGFFSCLVLFIFTGGLQKTKCFATIPRVEMVWSPFWW